MNRLDLGPLRIVPIDDHYQRTDWDLQYPDRPKPIGKVGETTALLIVTVRKFPRTPGPPAILYCRVPIDPRWTDEKVFAACDFDNALTTLEYLAETPEISEC